MLVVKILLHLIAMAVVLIALARFQAPLNVAGWIGIGLILWGVGLVAWVVRELTRQRPAA